MKNLEVRLIKSLIGRPLRQRRTVASLGLKRINQVCLVEDRPSIRGMLKKIQHLVKVQYIESAEDKS